MRANAQTSLSRSQKHSNTTCPGPPSSWPPWSYLLHNGHRSSGPPHKQVLRTHVAPTLWSLAFLLGSKEQAGSHLVAAFGVAHCCGGLHACRGVFLGCGACLLWQTGGCLAGADGPHELLFTAGKIFLAQQNNSLVSCCFLLQQRANLESSELLVCQWVHVGCS